MYKPLINGGQGQGIDEVDRDLVVNCDNEEILNIMAELDASRRQLNNERQRVSELEDQLSSLSKCWCLIFLTLLIYFSFLTLLFYNSLIFFLT